MHQKLHYTFWCIFATLYYHLFILSKKTATSSCESQGVGAWTSPGASPGMPEQTSRNPKTQAAWAACDFRQGFSLWEAGSLLGVQVWVSGFCLAEILTHFILENYLCKPIWTVLHIWFIIETTEGSRKKNRQNSVAIIHSVINLMYINMHLSSHMDVLTHS